MGKKIKLNSDEFKNLRSLIESSKVVDTSSELFIIMNFIISNDGTRIKTFIVNDNEKLSFIVTILEGNTYTYKLLDNLDDLPTLNLIKESVERLTHYKDTKIEYDEISHGYLVDLLISIVLIVIVSIIIAYLMEGYSILITILPIIVVLCVYLYKINNLNS